jgi:hypothetical protein
MIVLPTEEGYDRWAEICEEDGKVRLVTVTVIERQAAWRGSRRGSV